MIPVLTGHISNDILELCDHIVRRTKIQHVAILERNDFISAILAESGTTNIEELFSRLRAMRDKDILLWQMEKR